MVVVWIKVARIIFEYICKVELVGFTGGIGMSEKGKFRMTTSLGAKQLRERREPLYGKKQTGREWEKSSNINYMFLQVPI